jgi:hypothetical protein
VSSLIAQFLKFRKITEGVCFNAGDVIIRHVSVDGAVSFYVITVLLLPPFIQTFNEAVRHDTKPIDMDFPLGDDVNLMAH